MTQVLPFSLLFTFSPFIEDQEMGNFYVRQLLCICPCYCKVHVTWRESCEMPLSGLRDPLKGQARGKRCVFKALCADVHTGHRAQFQRVGHLIVLRPVAGFLAVLRFFVSSCFLHQKWDFQHLSASSLYHSRPLWVPSSHWLLWKAPGKCPVCVYECVHVCVCVFVCEWQKERERACTPTCLCACLYDCRNKRITVKEVPLLKIHQIVWATKTPQSYCSVFLWI